MSKEASAADEAISDRDATIERLQSTVQRISRELSAQLDNVRDANAVATRERNRRIQMQTTIDRMQARQVQTEQRLASLRRERRLLRSYSVSMRSLVQRRTQDESIIDLTFTDSDTEEEAEAVFGDTFDNVSTPTTRFLSRYRGRQTSETLTTPENFLVNDHAAWQEAVTEREIQHGEEAMQEQEREAERLRRDEGNESDDLLGSMFRQEDDQQ
jgi:hypothetical protein